jgi:hypothetical protein
MMLAKLFGSQRKVVAVTILVAGLILVSLMLTPGLAGAQETVGGGDAAALQRGRDASAARYTAAAQAHAARPSGVQRGREATSARYAAMAQSGSTKQAQERGISASAARYNAMAQAHATRPSGIQRGRDAASARYAGMARAYGSMEVAGTR